MCQGSGVRESGFEIHVYVSDDRHDGDEYEGGYKPLDYCFHVFVFCGGGFSASPNCIYSILY